MDPVETLDSPDAVRHNILQEALAEFARLGLAGARIEAITERTHTSKRMIYYHFGSKRGLYEAVLRYAFQLVRNPAAGAPGRAGGHGAPGL